MCEEKTFRLCTEWSGDLAEGTFNLIRCKEPWISLQDPAHYYWKASADFNFNSDEPLQLLTKGDNNAADDTELYAVGQSYLERKKDVIGSVVGYVPMVGYVTILLSEYPWLKTAMLAIMGLTVVLQRE